MDDHDHEHEHDDGEHAYERAFGRVGGSFLGRTKSVGSASASGGGADSVGGGGGVFGWRGRGTSLGDGELGRRRSIQEGPASSPTTNADNSVNVDSSGVVGSGMRPRRVSFGWTGFGGGVSKPTSTPGPGSGSSSGSGSGPGSGGVSDGPGSEVGPVVNRLRVLDLALGRVQGRVRVPVVFLRHPRGMSDRMGCPAPDQAG
jgi:hypothetical protein